MNYSFLRMEMISSPPTAVLPTVIPISRYPCSPRAVSSLSIVDVFEVASNLYDDLAVRTGITSGNAAVRVHRAREALRKQVRTACGSCAEHGCLDCHCKPEGSSAHCAPDKS